MQRREHRPEHGVPSQAARDRLARGLADEIAEFKVRLSEVQLRSEALEAAGCREAAVDAVDEQRELLAELEQRMGVVLSRATAEREAETVIDEALADDEAVRTPRRLPALAGFAVAAVVALLLGLSPTTGGARLTGATTDLSVDRLAPGDGTAGHTSSGNSSTRDGETDATATAPRGAGTDGRADPIRSGRRASDSSLALPSLLAEFFGLPSSLAGESEELLDGLPGMRGPTGASVRDGWEAAASARIRLELLAESVDATVSDEDPSPAAENDQSADPEATDGTSSEHSEDSRTGTREGAPSSDSAGSGGTSDEGSEDSAEGDGTEPTSDPGPSDPPFEPGLDASDPGVGGVGPSGD